MDKENVLVGHIMVDLAFYPITSTLSVEEKANYYDAIMKKYRHEDYQQHLITEKVRMCFDFSCVDIDKCKQWHERKDKDRKEHSSKGGIKSGEVRRAKKAKESEQQAEATAQPSDDIPCAEVEVVDPHSFDVFWNLYKYKRGKALALKAWNKLKDSDKAAAIEAVPNYLAYLDYKRATGREQEQMHASTYLNQRRWEDDYTITTPINTNYHGNNKQQQHQQQLPEVFGDLKASRDKMFALNVSENGDRTL